jgi:hypothetical protein
MGLKLEDDVLAHSALGRADDEGRRENARLARCVSTARRPTRAAILPSCYPRCRDRRIEGASTRKLSPVFFAARRQSGSPPSNAHDRCRKP